VSPARSDDLHGNAPDKCAAALLLIDVINDFDFPEAEQLFEQALPMARQIAALKARAEAAGVPVIYANDNFGRWRSDFRAQVEHCLRVNSRARQIAELLRPGEDDYFVLKPKNSGFFSTTLDILLRYLQVRSVILTGVAGNNCVLFTAHDAYLRDLRLVVPEDCVASNTAADNRAALHQIRTVLKGDTRPSAEIDLTALRENLPCGASPASCP
jgi:nicotinamidase-related amidase